MRGDVKSSDWTQGTAPSATLGTVATMNEDIQRRAVAEFIGSFALTFIGAGAIITIAVVGSGKLLAVALASGLIMAIFVSAFGHISGALQPGDHARVPRVEAHHDRLPRSSTGSRSSGAASRRP